MDPWVPFCFGNCSSFFSAPDEPRPKPWPSLLPLPVGGWAVSREKVEAGRRGAGGRPEEAKLKMKLGKGQPSSAWSHVCITAELRAACFPFVSSLHSSLVSSFLSLVTSPHYPGLSIPRDPSFTSPHATSLIPAPRSVHFPFCSPINPAPAGTPLNPSLSSPFTLLGATRLPLLFHSSPYIF